MLKLYKKFRPIDWVLVIIIVGLTILQVYCTMLLTDCIKNLISSIGYVQMHNTFQETINSTSGMTWESLKEIIETKGLPYETIKNASTIDIWYQGGMMVLIAFGYMACQMTIAVMAAYISSNFATTMRRELNNKITSFSPAETNKFSTSSLVTRTTNDIQQVQMANLLMLRMIFAAPVTAIWAICKINSTSWQLTTATIIAVILLISFLVMLMFVVLPKFNKMQKLVDNVNSITSENLLGIRVIRAYNAEDYQMKKFKKVNDDLTNTQLFTSSMMSLLSPFISLIMNGLTLAIYWIGAGLINNNEIDYSTITSFIMLATQIVMSFMMLLFMFILLPRAEVAAKRINQVLDEKVSIEDPKEEEPLPEDLKGCIEFRHVDFKYPDAEENILKDINFIVHKGETIAFIGSTGSGKSTLINLVPRFYDVTDGEILLDGVNIKNLKQETLRSKIGFVPQKGLLFSGTIKSNIAFGNPSLSEEDIKEAARIACADEFIGNMENGYDSPIARGGTNVSGGQRQRLCIARAIAIKPEFLVFDDSFSALDFKTDKKVRENLKESQKDVTKLIVAQRIGTIMDADTIVVLSEGKVVGIGKHMDLLETCSEYKEIALSQLSKEELGL